MISGALRFQRFPKREDPALTESLTAFAATLYDTTGDLAASASAWSTGKRIMLMFPTNNPASNTEIYLQRVDERFRDDHPETAAHTKRAFLMSAPTALIHLTDIPGISFAVTAIRLLLEEALDRVVLITTFNEGDLRRMWEAHDVDVRALLTRNRYFVVDHLDESVSALI